MNDPKETETKHVRELLADNRITEMYLPEGKRPRQYAAEIVSSESREARRELLAAVPEPCRARVELMVRNVFELRAKR